jgi:hypothetical protein
VESSRKFRPTLVWTESGNYEIYIPAPDEYTREEAFRFHITTRNFFAYLFEKPLVGVHLGQSMIDLQERMAVYRSTENDNNEDFLAFAEEMGYLDFSHSPDYALSALFYAEHFQNKDLWTDAFAHCVGMNDALCLSSEFEVSG